MKKFMFFFPFLIYADISQILLKLNQLENYKPRFKEIYFKKCKKKTPTPVIEETNSNGEFDLQLVAIFNKKALINNEWVKEGDFIKGYQVIKIYSKRVILKKGNKIFILRFNNNFLKVKK